MRRFLIFIAALAPLEAAELLLVGQFHGPIGNGPSVFNGVMIFDVLPGAISLFVYHWLKMPADGPVWRAVHYLNIFVLAPLVACVLSVLFLYGLCNVEFFRVCDFP